MLIKDITQPKCFFDAVAKCQGRVELITSDGDRLNMKSTLCQYIALTQMFEDGFVRSIELSLSDPADFEKLMPYLVVERH